MLDTGGAKRQNSAFLKELPCNAMIFTCYLTLETLKDFFLVSQSPLKTQWTQDFWESGWQLVMGRFALCWNRGCRAWVTLSVYDPCPMQVSLADSGRAEAV